ncbi:MAG: SPOR domain-containing protein [Gammaproteobacteria bacterium]|nr:SPOR domain-containing protein [Gammaproteobacteria bacterium]
MAEQPHRQKQNKQPRCFLSLAAGILIGFSLAVFIYLYEVVSSDPKVADAAQDLVKRITPAGSKAPAKEPQAVAKPTPPTFDFYEVLPREETHTAENYTDIVPPSEPSAIQPPRALKTPQHQPGTYMLQAAAFRDLRIADEFKENLALRGIHSVIQHVTLKGVIWYRVRVGPFANINEAHRMQDLIKQNGFPDAMLLKF